MLQLFHLFSSHNPKRLNPDWIMLLVFIFMATKYYVVLLRLLLDWVS